MRQVDDQSYHRLLRKMREGLTDLDDYMKLLQSCMATTVNAIPPTLARKCIVRENKIRHCVNLMQILSFVKTMDSGRPLGSIRRIARDTILPIAQRYHQQGTHSRRSTQKRSC